MLLVKENSVVQNQDPNSSCTFSMFQGITFSLKVAFRFNNDIAIKIFLRETTAVCSEVGVRFRFMTPNYFDLQIILKNQGNYVITTLKTCFSFGIWFTFLVAFWNAVTERAFLNRPCWLVIKNSL